MSRFSAEWLALREPYDLRARNQTVLNSVIAQCGAISVVNIVDLGCGIGSTLRAIAPRIPMKQNWRLFDNDPALLAHAMTTARPGTVDVDTVLLDLSRDLEAVFQQPVDIVTISALLDLVSDTWIDRLAAAICSRAIPLYAALSYNGHAEFTPADPFDAVILAAVNAHQRTDKGFGQALGPDSGCFAISRLQALGYSVVQDTSDWVLGPLDRDIQSNILLSWAGAAAEAGAAMDGTLNWLARRSKFVDSGQSSIRICHIDFWARQTGTL